jgi:hypothetical protein
MNGKSPENSRSSIERQHRVCQAIRGNHFALLKNDQIVEAMLSRAFGLEASQQFSRGIKMQEFRSPAVGEGIGPHCAVAGTDSNAKNRQESKAVGRHEIVNVTVSANLHNLSAIQAAQIKNTPLRVIRQAFGNQVFLRSSNRFARLRHNGKVTVHIFALRREFLRFFQLQKGGISRRIESFLQCETFFQECQRLAALS